jgi:hypothetical protein
MGGIIDVIFSRADLGPLSVSITDAGLSDHHLLTWSVPFTLPPLVYKSVSYRPWKCLDTNEFTRALVDSPLCKRDSWEDLDAHQLAELYDTTITAILDRLVPIRSAKLRSRPSDQWFDGSCLIAKRVTRRLERHLRNLRRYAARHPALCVHLKPAIEVVKASFLNYHSLLKRKRELFWQAKFSSDDSARGLWRSFDSLLGRCRPPHHAGLSASDFATFFNQKVSNIRDATAGRPPPSFARAGTEATFNSFQPVTSDEVASAIRRLPLKSSSSDPLNTSLLKVCACVLVPFITQLFNTSLSTGVFPRLWKHARVTPLLKAGNLNPLDTKSYRPISNLPVLSKLLEKIVSKQLLSHLHTNELLPGVQSAFRPNHSTETAIHKIATDVLKSFDSGNVCLLCSLDLTAAFDSIDHSILLSRLHLTFGLSDTLLVWIESFVRDRTQSVCYLHSSSPPVVLDFGVPQGSVLGPLLFILFSSELSDLVRN